MHEVPGTDEILGEIESLEVGLPFEDYAKDQAKLREIVGRLEKEYDVREKSVQKILEYGSGIESEKALRMLPTLTLQKWESALEVFRSEQLKK